MTGVEQDERTRLLDVVERHGAALDQMADVLHAGPLAPDLGAELTLLARWVLAEHEAQRPLMHVLQRDGEHFPELAVAIRDRIVDRGYRHAVEWLRRRIEAGGFPPYDAEAVTVVALGSLVAYAAHREMLGEPTLAVDEDRFVATWVETWLRVARTAEDERVND